MGKIVVIICIFDRCIITIFIWEACWVLSLSYYCWESDWKLFKKQTWCLLSVFFCDIKLFLQAVGILSLFKYSLAHLVHCCFVLQWKILAWGRCNFEVVQIFLKIQIGDSFVVHAWCSLCVFFRDGQIVAGILNDGFALPGTEICVQNW